YSFAIQDMDAKLVGETSSNLYEIAETIYRTRLAEGPDPEEDLVASLHRPYLWARAPQVPCSGNGALGRRDCPPNPPCSNGEFRIRGRYRDDELARVRPEVRPSDLHSKKHRVRTQMSSAIVVTE